MLHDRSGVVGHIFDNLLGGEDFVYLSSDTTSEPWSGAKKLFGVFLEIVFDREDTLVKEGLGLSLAVILPDEKKKKQRILSQPTSECIHELTNRRRKDS